MRKSTVIGFSDDLFFMKIADEKYNLDTFVQSILNENIKVGAVMRQAELCEVLGISLSPLRDLLVLLEELELIEVKPRSGFKVIYPDIDFMRENMQFRIILEKHAIEAFVEIVTTDWIKEQISIHEKAIKDLEDTDDPTTLNENILELDRQFHRTIVGSLENRAITKAHEYTQTKLQIARQVHRRVPPKKTNMIAMRDHLNILAALETQELARVHTALDEHFNTSIRNTLVGY